MTQLYTEIIAATVYPDRARLTRRGSINLEAGIHHLEIPGISPALNPESLRTSARGTARARMLGADVKRAFYAETPSVRVRQMEARIDKLKDELQSLDSQAQLIKKNRTNLDDLAGQVGTFAMALAASEMTLDQQLALFDSLRKQAEKLDKESQLVQVRRRETDRQLQKLVKELELQHSIRPRERFTASVEVEVLEPGDLAVDVSYMVSSAGWKPLYDLRLLEKEGAFTLEVSYLAQISQDTGENWDQVNLTLSTSRPALARELPELEPWYIGQSQPIMRMKSEPLAQMSAPPSITYQAQPAPHAPFEEEVEQVVSEAVTSSTSVTYTIPGTANIPPDGAVHKAAIARFWLAPHIDYVTAPKLAEAVYRRAKMINDSIYTLLPGEANVFIGDEFIGAIPLELIAPREEVDINLGIEDRVKVERNLKRRDVDKRFIGGKRHFAFGYEIKIENLLPSRANLTLHDQIPLSRHEVIKVKLESAEPRPLEQSELNLLKWELALEPHEKREVRFDFSVESPQDMELVGLP